MRTFPVLSSSTRRSGVGRAVGLAGLAALGVGAFGIAAWGGPASAQSSTVTSTPKATSGGPAALTDAQKTCLAAKGVTLPAGGRGGHGRGPGGNGTTTASSTPTTKAASSTDPRAAFEAAAKACGITLPAGGPGGPGGPGGHDGDGGRGGRGGPMGGLQLTDAQKTCLTSKGVTIPTRPAAGTATTPTTKAASSTDPRAAFEAAAKACGITLPTGGPGGRGGDHDGMRGGTNGATSGTSGNTNTAKAVVRA